MASQYINEKLAALDAMMDAQKDRDYVTVEEAAEFLGMGQDTLRALIANRNIPWAIGAPPGVLKHSRYARIPKVSFYAFCVQNVDSTRRLVAI